jgi:hypothetical protein
MSSFPLTFTPSFFKMVKLHHQPVFHFTFPGLQRQLFVFKRGRSTTNFSHLEIPHVSLVKSPNSLKEARPAFGGDLCGHELCVALSGAGPGGAMCWFIKMENDHSYGPETSYTFDDFMI